MQLLTNCFSDKRVYASVASALNSTARNPRDVVQIIMHSDEGDPGIHMQLYGDHRNETAHFILIALDLIGFQVLPEVCDAELWETDETYRKHMGESTGIYNRFIEARDAADKKKSEGEEELDEIFISMKDLASFQGVGMSLTLSTMCGLN